MAQLRQQQQQQSGSDPYPLSAREHVSIRIPNRIRRHIRPDKRRLRLSFLTVFAVTLALGLSVTLLAFHHLSDRSKEDGPGIDSRENWSNRSKELKFGLGLGGIGRDSRYWDRDDRRRDQDYDEEDVLGHGIEKKVKDLGFRHERDGGLYNEGGRGELDSYKVEFEAKETGLNDEYDDGIDVQDEHGDDEENGDGEDNGRKLGDVSGEEKEKGGSFSANGSGSSEVSKNGSGSKGDVGSGSGRSSKAKRKPKRHKSSGSSCDMKFLNSTTQLIEPLEKKKFSRFSLQYTEVEERPSGSINWEPRFAGHQTPQEREESYYARDQKINCGFIKGTKGSPSTGFDLAEDDVKYMSSCHIAVSSCIFGNSDHLRMPYNKVTYCCSEIHYEQLVDPNDHTRVCSEIHYEHLVDPNDHTRITRQSRKGVCFIMFMDESTLQTLSSEGQKIDSMGFISLWKVVVVRNLPYTDMRRVGKIPKFLTHRLFPSARYSIWLDSKLRLQSDPYLILEYFLWRKGYEYAISNHYDRHCVWEEVAQNKKLNKFNHTVIDQQFEFYQSDGLKRFEPSDPNKLLPSYVPEGSFIVRAHTPMSNLFSCLWFNEVDHFTPRDQLSFAYTYLKLSRMNLGITFHLNMFKDCERRKIAKLFRHRAEDKRNLRTQTAR